MGPDELQNKPPGQFLPIRTGSNLEVLQEHLVPLIIGNVIIKRFQTFPGNVQEHFHETRNPGGKSIFCVSNNILYIILKK